MEHTYANDQAAILISGIKESRARLSLINIMVNKWYLLRFGLKTCSQ